MTGMHIEFYFCNKNHLDIITYPRKLDAGKWFFHQSGVDLTFNSSYEGHEKAINTSSDFYYGGILIRDIVKRSDMEKKYGGPYKCEWELFDFLEAFSPTSQVPYLEKNSQSFGINIEEYKIKREFSYDGQKVRTKYNELYNYYYPKINLSEKTFVEFLDNINYGFNIFKALTNKNKIMELNTDIYTKLHKNLVYSRIDNEHIINDLYHDEVSILKIKTSHLILESNKSISSLFKVLNDINNNYFVCDFKDKEFFFVKEITNLIKN